MAQAINLLEELEVNTPIPSDEVELTNVYFDTWTRSHLCDRARTLVDCLDRQGYLQKAEEYLNKYFFEELNFDTLGMDILNLYLGHDMDCGFMLYAIGFIKDQRWGFFFS